MLRTAALPATSADRNLAKLSEAANGGRLWLLLGGLLVLRPGEFRRAGLRGMAAVGGASLLANLLGKQLFARRRPPSGLMPRGRSLANPPGSAAFPSGHAANAFAFVTAAAMERKRTGAALAPLAAAVAYSRVHTGMHWPSDVLAGAALGSVAALATRHWWPLRTVAQPHAARPAQAPPLPDGTGLLLFHNPESGNPDIRTASRMAALWPNARLVELNRRPPVDAQVESAVAANQPDLAALGVAGGDGTVAAVAAVAHRHRLPLVVVPTGTLNHFARDIGIGAASAAVRATRNGMSSKVDLGLLQVTTNRDEQLARWFVNTASLGGYPAIVRVRNLLEPRYGRHAAMIVAMIRTLRRAQPIPVLLNGRARSVWLLFVGNGSYQPKEFSPVRRQAMHTGLLDVRYLRADLPYSRTRFVLAALTRSLAASRVYHQFDAYELDVRLPEGATRIATDGELGPLGRRFLFRTQPRALTVYRSNDTVYRAEHNS